MCRMKPEVGATRYMGEYAETHPLRGVWSRLGDGSSTGWGIHRTCCREMVMLDSHYLIFELWRVLSGLLASRCVKVTTNYPLLKEVEMYVDFHSVKAVPNLVKFQQVKYQRKADKCPFNYLTFGAHRRTFFWLQEALAAAVALFPRNRCMGICFFE